MCIAKRRQRSAENAKVFLNFVEMGASNRANWSSIYMMILRKIFASLICINAQFVICVRISFFAANQPILSMITFSLSYAIDTHAWPAYRSDIIVWRDGKCIENLFLATKSKDVPFIIVSYQYVPSLFDAAKEFSVSALESVAVLYIDWMRALCPNIFDVVECAAWRFVPYISFHTSFCTISCSGQPPVLLLFQFACSIFPLKNDPFSFGIRRE